MTSPRAFEDGPHPVATVTESRLLIPTASTVGLPGSDQQPLRARAWEEGPCFDNTSTTGTHMPCLHIVVVNTLRGTPIEFSLRVDGDDLLKHQRQVEINATRLFDASYNVTLGLNGSAIVLHDWVGAGDTNVYEVGCTGPKPLERNDGSSPPWQSCANRRVTCWDHTAACRF